ncbi:PAS domain-containing sensor histidine kinase [Hyalangium rubrum]|uniref:histidine kinase n=1 Tax=Hyalangium rubrum TaxID=3103134 RepID=A0ABU5GVC8_9BACT|nr:PAS domain S-box protein [Hyalangium sp. s54d21]MDY7225137.1 PAS domain S-box protein [Hyalangium sp. s54d21]
MPQKALEPSVPSLAIEDNTEAPTWVFLKTMAALAPMGLVFVDPRLRILHLNATLAGYTGIPIEAHLGREVKEVMPDLWCLLESHYRQVLKEVRPLVDLEFLAEMPKAPGVRRNWRVNFYPIHDRAGALCGIGTVITDVTEQKQADEALKASERRYRSLVEATAQTVWTLNVQGEITEPASSWQAFTGQTQAEQRGQGWLAAIHPEDKPRVVAEWTAAQQRREPYQGEFQLQHHRTLYRDVSVRCVPVFHDDGSVLEWIGVAEDISSRKQVERSLQRTTQALRLSEEHYRTFINQSTEGIWRMELTPPIAVDLPEDEQIEAMLRRGYLAEGNAAMARMHGLHSPSALVGRRLDQVFVRTRPADVGFLRAFIRSGYRLENAASNEQGRDGKLKMFLCSLVGVVEEGCLVRAWGTQRDVTEQSLAQQELEFSKEEARRSEQQLRNITDALPALVSYIDRDERVLFCNQVHETWFGVPPEQLLGKTVREIFRERYVTVKDWTRKALDGETVRYDTSYQRKDGQRVCVQCTYSPIRDAHGEVQGFVAHVHDITDRKQAEAEVEAERARLQDILMSTPASISILSGPEQVFTLVNPIFRRLSHDRELLGRSLEEVFSATGSNSFSEMVRRAYETGEPIVTTEVAFRASPRPGTQEERFFDVRYQPLRDAQGHVDSVMSFAIDVTDKVRTRQKLEEWAHHLASQEEWLRSVLDFMPVALLLLEPGTGRVLFANQIAHRMAGGTFPMGVPTEEYDRFYELLREDGTPMPLEQVPGVRAARGERVQGAGVIWKTPSGRHFLLIDSTMIPASHGHPATALLVLQDVTQLKQMQAQLQAAVRLRDEFLTVASHELKTPLTPLQMRLHALMRDSTAELSSEELRERVRKAAESSSAQVRKLVELINDLLDVGRLTEGRLSLSLEPLDLAAVVREVARRFEPQARRAQCPLIVQAPEAVVGAWDSSRLEQVVANLLSNAIKYGPGRPVVMRVERREGRALLSVVDEGIGIAPEKLGRVFEKFERAVSPLNYGGLGLGLYISRQIVLALGGTIQVESQPGRGSTFTIELPLLGAHPSHEVAASAASLGSEE